MMPCNLWNPFESCWHLQKTSSKPFDALRLETHGGSIMKKNRHKRRPRFTKRRSLEFPCEHMLYASTCLHYRYPEMQSTGSQNQANQSRMMNVHQWLTTAVSPSIAKLRKRIILYFCTKILWVRRIPKDCLDGEPPIEEWAINCSRRSKLTHPCNSVILLPTSKYVTVCISRLGSSPINLRSVSSSSWFCCQASWIVNSHEKKWANYESRHCVLSFGLRLEMQKKLYCKYHDCIMYLTVTKVNEEVWRGPSATRKCLLMYISKDLAQDMPHCKTITVSLNAFHNSETEWLGWRIPRWGTLKTSSVSLLQLLPLMQALKRRQLEIAHLWG